MSKDTIYRQDAIDLAVQIIKEWHGLEEDDADAIKYKFMGLPSAQQIVRCKDCRWYEGDYCQKHGDDWGGEWFCADAELMRKGERG